MLAERSFGSDGAPEHNARFRHGRGDDVWIVAFLRRALVEEIAVGAPRFQSRFHRGSSDRKVKEAKRSLVGLQFSHHEAFLETANCNTRSLRLPREQASFEASE